VDWSDIELQKDMYDWSYVDAIMDEWGEKGYRFAFRVCCYEGDPALPYATPQWLRKMGCGGADISFRGTRDTAWEPDYGDPLFLERLEAFVQQYAEKFDGHPAAEYVDWGSYGTWGEGHTWMGSQRTWPVSVLKRHVDIHAQHFRKTPVLMNDDIISVRKEGSDEEKWDLMNYCRTRGLGIRDDSVCVAGVAAASSYDSLRAPWLFDLFWEQAPVDIECEHFQNIRPEVMKDGFPFLAAVERTHATYAGFHGYPRQWLEGHRYLTEYVANRLGYWYFLEGLDLPPESVANAPVCMDLYWRNAGFARAYRRFSLRLRLENASTGQVYDLELLEIDNRRWVPGELCRERVKVALPEMPAGAYKVKIRMYEPSGAEETVIHLAVREECLDADGYVELGILRVGRG
jgi:hypothetical protein